MRPTSVAARTARRLPSSADRASPLSGEVWTRSKEGLVGEGGGGGNAEVVVDRRRGKSWFWVVVDVSFFLITASDDLSLFKVKLISPLTSKFRLWLLREPGSHVRTGIT